MKATIKQLEVYYLMRRYFASRMFPGDYHHISFETGLNVEIWKFDINGVKHAIQIMSDFRYKAIRLYKENKNGEYSQIGVNYET